MLVKNRAQTGRGFRGVEEETKRAEVTIWKTGVGEDEVLLSWTTACHLSGGGRGHGRGRSGGVDHATVA